MVNELEKWDKLYSDYETREPPHHLLELGNEIIQSLNGVVKKTDAILEAGCGSAAQSLAMYRAGYRNIVLFDFSENALRVARQMFEKENPGIRTIQGDLAEEDASEQFDLVYNCGVLEHYEKVDRVKLLEGMASRSRNLVLVLIPNASCYWYWIWRIHAQSDGNWVFGKELAGINIASDFKKSGINYLGHSYFGKKWTEQFIHSLQAQQGINADLAGSILELHNKNIVPPASQAYLIGYLGTVDSTSAPASLSGWKKRDHFVYAHETMTCALADAIASNVHQQSDHQNEMARLQQHILELERLSVPRTEYESVKSQHEHLSTENQALIAERDSLAALEDRLENDLDTAKQHIKSIKSQHEHLSAEHQALIAERDSLAAQKDRLENDLDTAKQHVESVKFQHGHLSAEHQAVMAERDSLAELKDRLENDLDTAERCSKELLCDAREFEDQRRETFTLAIEAKNKLRELKTRKGVKVAKVLNYVYWNVMKGSLKRRLQGLRVLCKRAVSRHVSISDTHFLDALDVCLSSIQYQCQSPLRTKEEIPLCEDGSLPGVEVEKSSEEPLVSVVLPVYNQANFLADSIESVLEQSYDNWELIIINDGSTDDVETVLGKYSSHPKIILLTQDNQKLPKALTNAFQFATGTYVTWTSADNLMHPRQLERLASYLQVHPDVDMVYSDYCAIDDSGSPLTEPEFRPHNRPQPDSPEIHLPRDPSPINEVADNFIGPSFMYRRSGMKIIGEYDPQLGVEDYDYWMRINSLLKIEHLGTDEMLYYYRVHNNSLNARAKELKIAETVSRLMSYEKERAEFYNSPWEVVCSREFLSLNSERFSIGSLTQFTPGHAPQNTGTERRLLLVSANDIPLICSVAKDYDCICAWFAEGQANLVYKYQYPIGTAIDACFCLADTKEYERLNIVHPNVIECQREDLLEMAIAFANNHLFYNKTRSHQERKRLAPEVFNRRHDKRIMLQMDEYSYGGVEQVVLYQAETLAAMGSEVFICTCTPSQVTPKIKNNRVRLLCVDPSAKEESYKALLRESQIDIVNAHYSTFGAEICCQMGIPFVQTVHNMYVWLNEEQKKTYYEKDAYTRAYICVSNNVAWYSNEILRLPEKKTVVITNGVDIDHFRFDAALRTQARKRFGFTDADYVLLNMASVYATKGQKHLVEAFADAVKACPDLKLVIAGHIAELAYYEQLVKRIDQTNLSDRIMHGKRFDEARELYHAADALVIPSFWEGCSLAIAEGVAMGLPILSSRVGDVENQTNMDNCIVVDLPVHFLTDLDKVDLPKLLYGRQKGYVRSIEEGMCQLYHNHRRLISEPKRQKVDGHRAYSKYDKFFDFILGGGRPDSARNWLRQVEQSQSGRRE
ncbi:MAG: glycosyltransferase [Phycisphaerales bacterium]|nr:MAG: glycosyltransferase [Phycisphaerales bacterium]